MIALTLGLSIGSNANGSLGEMQLPETVADRISSIVGKRMQAPDVQAHSDKYGMPATMVEIEPGVKLFVIDQGQGVPIIFLNGGPGNSLQSFIPHFSRAKAFSRTIYYDPRGVGRSTWHPGANGYSTSQAIEDLEKLRQSLNIERWVLLGWSWGGLLAQRYALEHPHRVSGLVLLASSESMGLEKDADTFVNNLSATERARIKEVYQHDGQRVVPRTSETLGPDQVRELVYNGYVNGDWKRQFYYKPNPERMAHVAQHEWRHDVNYNRQMANSSFDLDLSERFSKFKPPVILFYGAWDMSFSKEMPVRLAGQFPKSELHVFEHSSHNPFASQPDKFFELLEKWINEQVTLP